MCAQLKFDILSGIKSKTTYHEQLQPDLIKLKTNYLFDPRLVPRLKSLTLYNHILILSGIKANCTLFSQGQAMMQLARSGLVICRYEHRLNRNYLSGS